MYAAAIMTQYNVKPWKPEMTFSYPPVRTLLDMSEKEIVELEKYYNCPVIRPTRPPDQMHA